jgi:flagellin-specific chaperone FliS
MALYRWMLRNVTMNSDTKEREKLTEVHPMSRTVGRKESW